MVPKAAQTPHPPLWVGASQPKAIERAARLGCHFLGGGDSASQSIYDTALRAHGRDPKDYHAAQLRWVYVAPTYEQAWNDVQDHLHYMLTWYGRWVAEAKDFAGAEKLAQLPPAAELRNVTEQLIGRPIVGTPEDVGRQIETMTKRIRTTHLVMGMHLPGLDPAKSQRSMELFAKELMPTLH
jgi:alkanesulfonate monooxygenase SsuD/methylene tetrahydromethanopterin reductase-like flavin-dependent oxidoreductase (luciferase family)